MFVINQRRFRFSDTRNRIIGLAFGLGALALAGVLYLGLKNANFVEGRAMQQGVSLSRALWNAANDLRGDLVTGIRAAQVPGTAQVRVSFDRAEIREKGRERLEVFRALQPVFSRVELERAVKVGEVAEGKSEFIDTVLRSGEFYYIIVYRNALNQYPLVFGRNSMSVPVNVAFPGSVTRLRAMLRDEASTSGPRKIYLSWKLPEGKARPVRVYRDKRMLSSPERVARAVEVARLDRGQSDFMDSVNEDGFWYYAVFAEDGARLFLAGDTFSDQPVTVGVPAGQAEQAPTGGVPFQLSLDKEKADPNAIDTDSRDAKAEERTKDKLRAAFRPFGDAVRDQFGKAVDEITVYYGFEILWSTDPDKTVGSKVTEASFTFNDAGRFYQANQVGYEGFRDKKGVDKIRFTMGLSAEGDQGYTVQVTTVPEPSRSTWGVFLVLLGSGIVLLLLFWAYLRYVGKFSMAVSLVFLACFAVFALRLVSQDVIGQLDRDGKELAGYWNAVAKGARALDVYRDADGPAAQRLFNSLPANRYNDQEWKLALDKNGRVALDASGALALDEAGVRAKHAAVFAFIAILFGFVLLAVSLPLVVRGAHGLFERFLNAVYNHRTAYLLTLPGILIMTLLVFGPLLYTFLLSMTHIPKTMHIIEIDIGRQFVGLANFGDILGVFNIGDPSNFYWTLKTTLLYTVFVVAFSTTLGISLALLLNKPDLRFRTAFRTLLILPWAMPTFISALVWQYLFDSRSIGFVNQLVYAFGGTPINWLYDPNLGFLVIVVASIWYSFPFIMVVTLGALQTIPADLYESATIDGASAWDKTRFITLPMVQPAVAPAVILSSIWTFNNFNFVYLINNGYDGTDILITRIYDFVNPEQLQRVNYALGAAFSTIIFVILVVYIMVLRRYTNFTERRY